MVMGTMGSLNNREAPAKVALNRGKEGDGRERRGPWRLPAHQQAHTLGQRQLVWSAGTAPQGPALGQCQGTGAHFRPALRHSWAAQRALRLKAQGPTPGGQGGPRKGFLCWLSGQPQPSERDQVCSSKATSMADSRAPPASTPAPPLHTPHGSPPVSPQGHCRETLPPAWFE